MAAAPHSDDARSPMAKQHSSSMGLWMNVANGDGKQAGTLFSHSSQLLSLRHFLADTFMLLKNRQNQDGGDEEAAFEVFDRQWSEKAPFDGCSWASFRSCLGESVICMLMVLKVREEHEDLYVKLSRRIIIGMLAAEPHLASVASTKEPYVGQTALHMACADGDLELVRALVAAPGVGLDARFTGRFAKEFTSRSPDWMKLDELVTPIARREGIRDACEQGVSLTPIGIALVAQIPDDVVIAITKVLINAGASVVYFDESSESSLSALSGGSGRSRKVMYTLLHELARGQYSRAPHADLISKERTKRILALFMDPASEYYEVVGRSVRNSRGLTALESAAALGNEAYFVGALDWMKVFVWQWGNAREVGFPLGQIDSATETDYMCALEYMTMYKRGNLLRLGLISQIIMEKWRRSGNHGFWIYFWAEVVTAILTAVVCLDNGFGYHATRWYCRIAALTFCTFCVSFNCLLVITCATPWLGWLGFQDRKERWWELMTWVPNGERVNISGLLMYRSTIMLFLSGVMVLSVPWAQSESLKAHLFHGHYSLIWQVFASAYWLLLPYQFLRYFEFFESTGPVSAAIPIILQQDMAPFLVIFSMIFVASAVALRIATARTASHGDELVGTFVNVLKTLEEAIHGPDAQWRAVIEEHPAMAGFVFIVFIWLTLIMMSVLIGMVTNRYDRLEAEVEERMLFRRAVFTITQDKVVPLWFYKRFQLQVGYSAEAIRDKAGAAIKSPSVCFPAFHAINSVEELRAANAWSTGGKHAKERFFPWSGGKASFELWKRPRMKIVEKPL